MEEKFKDFLVAKFRQIAPTKSASEFRKKILKDLMSRAQELKIKGIDDEDFIYNICIEELGDFNQTLRDFEQQVVKSNETKRRAIIGFAVAISTVMTLVITYLIVGGVTGLWHPTWLILLGGIFAGIIISTLIYVFNKKTKHPLLKRFFVAVDIALLAVFLFLLLEVGLNIDRSWQAFLVLPVAIFAVDTIMSFVYNSKIRWFELPVAVEIFGVMLFVLLGLNVEGFWHPGWVLCLIGALFALVELTIFIILKQKKNANKEKNKLYEKYKALDDKYYDDWD